MLLKLSGTVIPRGAWILGEWDWGEKYGRERTEEREERKNYGFSLAYCRVSQRPSNIVGHDAAATILCSRSIRGWNSQPASDELSQVIVYVGRRNFFRETGTRYRFRLKLHRVTRSVLWNLFETFPETVSRKVEQHPTRAAAPSVLTAMLHDAIASWNFLEQVSRKRFTVCSPCTCRLYPK